MSTNNKQKNNYQERKITNEEKKLRVDMMATEFNGDNKNFVFHITFFPLEHARTSFD